MAVKKITDAASALTAFSKRAARVCAVPGCLEPKKSLSIYCTRHANHVKAGKLSVKNSPLSAFEKVRIAFLFVARKVTELQRRARPDSEIKEEVYRVMMALFESASPEEEIRGINSDMTFKTAGYFSEDALDQRRRLRARKSALKISGLILDGNPIPFQIGRVLDEKDILTLHISAKISDKYGKRTGILLEPGLLIDKETILDYFDRSFKSGTKINVTVEETAKRKKSK